MGELLLLCFKTASSNIIIVFFITCKKIEVLLFTFSQRSQLLAKHLLKHTDGLAQKRFHWFLVQLIKLIALIYRTKDFCFVHRNI